MSFSLLVKKEICKLPLKEKCCIKAELLGVICFGGIIRNNRLTVKVENALVAKRISELTEECFGIQAFIKTSESAKKLSYVVEIANEERLSCVLEELGLIKNSHTMKNFVFFSASEDILEMDCCKRAFMRGAFLINGSCNTPDKRYHLEIPTDHRKVSHDLMDICEYFEISPKIIMRKSKYVLYLKDSEKIFDFLANISAVSCMLEFQNVKILKDVKNKVNRMVNCETANINKVVNASISQVNAIKKIDKYIGLSNLDEALREIALLRLENAELPLKELGEMLSTPLSKSGVNHRLKKLEDIASSIRKE